MPLEIRVRHARCRTGPSQRYQERLEGLSSAGAGEGTRTHENRWAMTTNVPPPRPFDRRVPPFALDLVRTIRRWRTPRLSSYAPRSTLVLPSHHVERACTPAIDFHAHLGRWLSPTGDWMERDVHHLLAEMDASNVESVVNLDGRWGDELEENLDRYDRAHPGRFFTFCHVDWRLLGEPRGPDRLASSLERSVAAGARGLKVWKDLGLSVTVHGRHVLPDDPMLSPVWEAAGANGLPVIIHVADPLAFFLPLDRHNERYEQMRRYPRGARHPGGAAAFHELLDSLEHLVASQPATTFVAAHACHAENLEHVGALLQRYSNLSIDVASAASMLGRQPRAARALILDHPDRVLFGTDVFPWAPGPRLAYFRLLETADEAFTYSDEPIPPYGRWQISGLDLPRAILESLYRENARSLLARRAAATDERTLTPVASREGH